METSREALPHVVIGTLLLGVLAAGCGDSSESDDPEATPTPTATIAATVSSTPTVTVSPTASLVTEGARLFFQETFEGNGRTCGTCHPPATGFTLTPEFIASLPPEDPLFVAERVPALADLESPALMRGPRALILENVDGFDQPPVFRGVPHTFDLTFSAPYGWSSSQLFLGDFVTSAVRQHFPRTLRREVGVDFRLPTEPEIAAIVAFMQSTTVVPDGNFDLAAFVTTEAQARGQALFFGNAKCSQCHSGALLTDLAAFDTGVTRRAINRVPPPECDPPCAPIGAREAGGFRLFDVPMLLGLGNSAPFFHDNSAATIREAVAHYTTSEFNASEGGEFVFGIQLTDGQIDDITAFLEALSPCGDGIANHGEPCDDGNQRSGDGCRPNCTIERCGDGIIDPGERCDRGIAVDPEDCTSRCDR
jgi:cysteine-rich repeat protein